MGKAAMGQQQSNRQEYVNVNECPKETPQNFFHDKDITAFVC
jgi:hypothetical protein